MVKIGDKCERFFSENSADQQLELSKRPACSVTHSQQSRSKGTENFLVAVTELQSGTRERRAISLEESLIGIRKAGVGIAEASTRSAGRAKVVDKPHTHTHTHLVWLGFGLFEQDENN